MVMNAPPQGRGGYTGTDAGASGFNAPPNILEDRDAAVARLLRMVGLSPSSLSPAAQAIRKKAGALANELVLRAGQTGGADVLADPGQSLGMLAGIVKEGLAGGKIFGGGGAKLGALENLAKLGATAEAGGEGVSPGMAIVQQLLANPANASELFRQAKYGGLSEKAQAGMALALETTMDAYRQQMDQGGLGAAGGGYGALLSKLLGKDVSAGGQAPTDAQGNPLGAGGSPGSAATAAALGAGVGAAGAGGAGGAPGGAPALGTGAAAPTPGLPGPNGTGMGTYGGNAAYGAFNPSLMSALQNWQPPAQGGPAAAATDPGFDYMSAISNSLPPPAMLALQALQQGGSYAQANPGVVSGLGGSLLPEPFGSMYRMGLGLRGSPIGQQLMGQ